MVLNQISQISTLSNYPCASKMKFHNINAVIALKSFQEQLILDNIKNNAKHVPCAINVEKKITQKKTLKGSRSATC